VTARGVKGRIRRPVVVGVRGGWMDGVVAPERRGLAQVRQEEVV